jgi:glycosyltransferase involved in cell wall biosynthesis
MSTGFWAVTFSTSAWLLAVGWLGQAFASLREMATLPDLARIDPDSLPPLPQTDLPHLSVLVPACNEEAAIQATLRSLLASTGVRLQIIAINDRSTDRTGALMNEVAAEVTHSPHSLVVIHNLTLPGGWLGKPYVLSLAAKQATAPWILLTDGDMFFTPRALELSLRCAEREQADHFCLFPTLVHRGIGEMVIHATTTILAQWTLHLGKVADPRAKDSFGMGCFNMIRREALDRIGGIEALKMQVTEDLALGWMVKQAGFRTCVAVGSGLLSIDWIQGWFGIVRNCEKNGFTILGYKLWLGILVTLGAATQVWLPLRAISLGGWNLVAGLLIYLGIALMIHANRRENNLSPLAAVLFAPAAAIVGYGIARSIFLTIVRNGVRWRGVHYPLCELRKHDFRLQPKS